eukprot:jgi/Tetstr1/431732/TSEL_021256.t1
MTTLPSSQRAGLACFRTSKRDTTSDSTSSSSTLAEFNAKNHARTPAKYQATGGEEGSAEALGSTGMAACFAPFTRRAHQVMDQELVVTSAAPEAGTDRTGSDWGSLLPGLLTHIFQKTKSGQTRWPRRRALFSVAGVCSNWRGVAYEVFFHAKHCSPSITHPCELFITRPYSIPTPLLHCLVVRERHPSGEGPTQYYMYLGEPEHERQEKFLLAASHLSKPGKDRFNMRMCVEHDAANEQGDTIATLKTNLLCTRYSLEINWPQASGSWAVNGDLRAERRKGNELVGNMKYRRNFFGFRGPRKLNVQFPVMGGKPLAHASDAEPAASRAAGHGSTQWSHVGMSSQRQLRAKRQPDAARKEPEEEEDALRPASTSSPASDSKIVLKNVPPHWHELLQCWCLNFGGRVKEASVKNFQLMHVGDEGVAMQFGKVSKDTFILDFNPTKIAPIQAFSVALSSFESKLPYE